MGVIMTRLKVFVVSSSEGLDPANAVRRLLVGEFRQNAEVRPWTREFELSATYIESLENQAREVDFAILVLTADDVITSREKEKPAPRDNVVFELGLFMGSLGRERCFIVKEKVPDLKLPTDLLGIHTASFKPPADRDWKTALEATCLSISERMAKLGVKHKLTQDALAAQVAIDRFSATITGPWWERIITRRDGASGISFFHIGLEALFSSVSLTGKLYDNEGSHFANWKSVIARVDTEEFKILYHWKGWHPTPDLASVPYHGFGELEFDRPAYATDLINCGGGRFWSVDEGHPERTVVKPVQLRRVVDQSAISTMTSGNEKDIRSLIKRTLLEW
jgi:predicted nucleotide-binding protein with TIR-like domain